jgi:circadian clock protein KaiB
MEPLTDSTKEFICTADSMAGETYVLRLYIAGSTPRSRQAIVNVKKICQSCLQNIYELKIIDIFQQPLLAKKDQVFAVPTLIKKLPNPRRLFIGDMSDTDMIAAHLKS